ncbi:hypothetical protein HK097_009762 [Rhizophlyctis rosea]|uniref:RRM domain-containing protein n=1 Tax=Rhizophlyctis rosea TaxID=64517 RepID=A0AAD5X075_9FUNG|nr:hypothetical protein HK097_009762 [Rhizophlyctis rosea]
MGGPDRFGYHGYRDNRMLPYGDRNYSSFPTQAQTGALNPNMAAAGAHWTPRVMMGLQMGAGNGGATAPGMMGTGLPNPALGMGALGPAAKNSPAGMGAGMGSIGPGLGNNGTVGSTGAPGSGMAGGGPMSMPGMPGVGGMGGMGGIAGHYDMLNRQENPYTYSLSNLTTPSANEKQTDAKERPCRTLFIRNIDYNATESEVRMVFGRYGAIKSIFDLINRRGMVFLTYWDLRSAERALTDLKHFDFRGRMIDIHYSLPKDDIAQREKCDRDQNQGTLLVSHSSQTLDNDHLKVFMSKFGDVKEVRDFKDAKRKFVEFFDSRDCVKAFDMLQQNNRYQGGTLEVFFIWDQPLKRSPGQADESVQSRSPSADPTRQGRLATPAMKIKPDPDAHMTEAAAAGGGSQESVPAASVKTPRSNWNASADDNWNAPPTSSPTHSQSWSNMAANPMAAFAAMRASMGAVDPAGPMSSSGPPRPPFMPPFMPSGSNNGGPMESGSAFMNNIPPNMFPPQMMAAFATAFASNGGGGGMGNMFSNNPMESPALAMFMRMQGQQNAAASDAGTQPPAASSPAAHASENARPLSSGPPARESSVPSVPTNIWGQPIISAPASPSVKPTDAHPTPRPSPDRERGGSSASALVSAVKSEVEERERVRDGAVGRSGEADGAGTNSASASASGSTTSPNANEARAEQLLNLLKRQSRKGTPQPPAAMSSNSSPKQSTSTTSNQGTPNEHSQERASNENRGKEKEQVGSESKESEKRSSIAAGALAGLGNMNLEQLQALAAALLKQKQKDLEEKEKGRK